VRLGRIFSVATLALLIGAPAGATPLMQVFVNGNEMDLQNMGELVTETDGDVTFMQWQMTTAEFQIVVSAVLDPDPVITYASSVIDFGAPTTFGFVFQQGIVPTSTPGTVTHTHSSSTTGGGGSTAPVAAGAPPAGIPVDGDATTEIAVYTLSVNGGTTFLNAGLDLSPSFTGAAGSDTQGPFSEGPSTGPAGSGSYDTMRVDVNFSMSGGNDAYTFNGEATVVPEPGMALQLGAALAAFALLRRRH
jgi:hypothetical protein